MSDVLVGLKPQMVFHYFEEICMLPHGSGNTALISDYLVKFASKRQLCYTRDEKGNVVIFKAAAPGYEEADTVMLQAHMDMVCEKNNGCKHDFTKDPLQLCIEGDYVYAKDTTLGGDDGIGVAMILAILDDSEIKAPSLECLITVDEEIGMLGAAALDASMLHSRILLNLDSEEEGIFLTSCAGGSGFHCSIPVDYENASGIMMHISVSGLKGGHSGADIHLYRANANVVMGRLISALDDRFQVSLAELHGGLQDNAIPRECSADLIVSREDVGAVRFVVSDFEATIRREYDVQDPDLKITIECMDTDREQQTMVLTEDSLKRVLAHFASIPNGVIKMSADIPGLVQTSLNLGIMKLSNDSFLTVHALRSSIASEREELSDRLRRITLQLGGNYEECGEYPAWEYKKDSRARELCHKLYFELYQKEPVICGIHAGLECGILSRKLQEIDCISMGPDIIDIHSPKERLSISSTERVFDFLLKLLERLD